MIRHPRAHRRRSEEERSKRLEELTPRQAIAIAEALLTSDLMRFVSARGRPRPRSLRIALGIPAERIKNLVETGRRSRGTPTEDPGSPGSPQRRRKTGRRP